MNQPTIPNINPFQVAHNQILVGERIKITRKTVKELVQEFHGDDAEVKAVAISKSNPDVAWALVDGWDADKESYERYWVWLTSDIVEWSLAAHDYAQGDAQ